MVLIKEALEIIGNMVHGSRKRNYSYRKWRGRVYFKD